MSPMNLMSVDVKPYERQPASKGCKLIGFDPLPCIWLLFGGGGASERIDVNLGCRNDPPNFLALDCSKYCIEH